MELAWQVNLLGALSQVLNVSKQGVPFAFGYFSKHLKYLTGQILKRLPRDIL